LLPRQAQSPDQTSNAAAAIIASKPKTISIVHHPPSRPWRFNRQNCR
jgi:hypothetical protein